MILVIAQKVNGIGFIISLNIGVKEHVGTRDTYWLRGLKHNLCKNLAFKILPRAVYVTVHENTMYVKPPQVGQCESICCNSKSQKRLTMLRYEVQPYTLPTGEVNHRGFKVYCLHKRI